MAEKKERKIGIVTQDFTIIDTLKKGRGALQITDAELMPIDLETAFTEIYSLLIIDVERILSNVDITNAVMFANWLQRFESKLIMALVVQNAKTLNLLERIRVNDEKSDTMRPITPNELEAELWAQSKFWQVSNLTTDPIQTLHKIMTAPERVERTKEWLSSMGLEDSDEVPLEIRAGRVLLNMNDSRVNYTIQGETHTFKMSGVRYRRFLGLLMHHINTPVHDDVVGDFIWGDEWDEMDLETQRRNLRSLKLNTLKAFADANIDLEKDLGFHLEIVREFGYRLDLIAN